MIPGKQQRITRGHKDVSKKSNLMSMPTPNVFRLPNHPTQKVQNSSLAPVANYASLSRKAADAENSGDAGITCLLARGRGMVRERLSSLKESRVPTDSFSMTDLERSHA